MKTWTVLIASFLILSYNSVLCKGFETTKGKGANSTIKVFASPDLIPIATKWVSEYSKLNPTFRVQLTSSVENNISGLLRTTTDLGFISDESFKSVRNQSTWNMVIGRDVVVPVINENNPLKVELSKKGATAQGLARLLQNTGKQNWETFCGNIPNGGGSPVHFYFVNDPSILSALSVFANIKHSEIMGTRVSSEQELVSAIGNDPYGLGFCRLNTVTNKTGKSLISQIKLLPIDKNGNGKIDYNEDFYSNLQEFSRGVWIGRYPQALSGRIYSISSAKPGNESQLAFLNWILTDGQQYLKDNGYSNLVYSERQSQLDKINEPITYASTPTQTNPILQFKFLLILLIGLTVVVLDLGYRRVKKSNRVFSNAPVNLLNVFKEAEVVIPKGLYFDKTHTWAFLKKDGSVKLGIDDFMQHVTGPITRVEIKASGEKIKKGDLLVTIIQHGKQLNIYSPLTGQITAQNKNLKTHSELLNTAPFTEGWVYIVEPLNWSLEIQFMNMADKYTNWLKSEYTRLRDFFASAVRVHAPAFVMILQDGGVIRDGILAELGPEVWDDFQTKFIDSAN